MDQTSAFYAQWLVQVMANLASFTIEFVDMQFDPSSDYPITIDFDAVMTFAPRKYTACADVDAHKQ